MTWKYEIKKDVSERERDRVASMQEHSRQQYQQDLREGTQMLIEDLQKLMQEDEINGRELKRLLKDMLGMM